MVYLLLFYEFFKIGLFAVGGGLAALPFLYELADKYTWFSHEMLVDMIAISESTPGPIGVNMATYAGYSAAGVPGGILASFALVIPSFFIVMAVARVLGTFKENRYVKSAFYGLRPVVTALIASSALGIVNITLLNLSRYAQTQNFVDIFNYKQLILFCVIFYAITKINKHPIYFIGASALAGIVFRF